ncbi:protein-ADP-ribose hydrolase [uncultured Lactobacillus sp.]|uniref:protein-ADP-ribose hydrolase n=1 Tax=uncultured Lactobacillus sp. TaxID=153152 RepID=UPI0028055337|nr:protein-ADP-ribose hydrolase [uncultured Lactobacillus sp.]
MDQEKRRVYLIKKLLAEKPEYREIKIPKHEKMQKMLLRALFNVREPKKMDFKFKLIQDQYLRIENFNKGVVKCDSFKPGISIWQGDITRLGVDAIVNAANSGMTGCYQPNHACIDNAIHTYAGIELRNKCDELMQKQGHLEETGKAKITPAYNLPSKYVIHTVGPIVQDQVTDLEKEQLRDSYLNCLKIADENKVRSIAFPCISTGVFSFPNELAAEIAVKTVQEFLQKKSNVQKVIFNVFKEKDRRIYESLLKTN